MTKGRKPLPTAIKEMRGTVQPCRVNKNELRPDVLAKLPPVPRWFTKTQRKIYKAKGEQLRGMGVLTTLDIELFVSFCREYGNYIDSSIELEKIPLLASLSEAQGNIVKRVSKVNKESWERAKSLASEFGFTPSSRAKLIITDDENPENADFS
jgi:P27 family predicted phage terminase small subunit